eukprot:TRINITY_DN1154_c0_g3_i1.p1 TRINITY_DN1154_c0_g3~~TRINITY_DN1154_c0_g3_i1.p1  ORF type:complete len:427 (-),score=69.92 TRINITY_DN1154_c0_g3_i1:160-1302(-)
MQAGGGDAAAGGPKTYSNPPPEIMKPSAAERLPLGFVGSAVLLVVFTFLKSSIGLLSVAAREGSSSGFPFLFETILVFPFTMQMIFYTCQTCWIMGTERGIQCIFQSAPRMGPVMIYSGFITATTVLETYSLQYLPPSVVSVLRQLTMVVLAVGEVVVLSMRPSMNAKLLICSQACLVAYYQYMSTHMGKSGLQADEYFGFGVIACLGSVLTGGFGTILQQRFMQQEASAIPVSVKLLYQHLVELWIVVALMLLRDDSRSRLMTYGFFGGWNRWTFAVTIVLWLYTLAASSVTAYVSALTGAVAVAVSVALTASLEATIFGRHFSVMQCMVLACVCFVAMAYARERTAPMRANSEDPKRQLFGPFLPLVRGKLHSDAIEL